MRNLINELYCLWFACATPVPVAPQLAPGANLQVQVTAPTPPLPAATQSQAPPQAAPPAGPAAPAPRVGTGREKSAGGKRGSNIQPQVEDGPPPPPPVPPTGYANLWRPWDHVYALVTAPKGGKGPPVVPTAALASSAPVGAASAGGAGAGGPGAQPAAGGAAAAAQSQGANATPPAPGAPLTGATPVPQAMPNLQQCVSALYNPAGKYAVKLFFMGCWRKVLVDDNIPFDALGRPLLPVSSNPLELWPLLLSKALLKIASLECALLFSFRATY